MGQVARLGPGPVVWLGRYHEKFEHEPPVLFFEQRPGLDLAAADLMTTKVSRRQLRFSEISRAGARVENVGRRPLLVNGTPAREAKVAPGDTLMLEHTAVFLVDARPRKLAPLAHYPAPSEAEPAVAFGAADACGMVGESPAAWRLRDELAAAARAEAHVLLLGETGAGKELAARTVHALSPRASGPLVPRNAATIPGGFFDAELFGCAKNYPSTGMPERVGLVGGHLMLDEIGELGEGHQAHLLRVLDEGGQYHRLGETRPRVSDLRLIAATNRPPKR